MYYVWFCGGNVFLLMWVRIILSKIKDYYRLYVNDNNEDCDDK